MKVYYSNKKLWQTYASILIAAAVLCLTLILFFNRSFVVILIFVLAAAALSYLAFALMAQHQKAYLEIDKSGIRINDFWKNTSSLKTYAGIKSLAKRSSSIVITFEDGSADSKINLQYVNAEDAKRIINYLRYIPSIKKKHFFS